jgi:RNA-binding protein
MTVTSKQRKFLRTLAHNRNPVIFLGKGGLNKNVIAETEIALDQHELIKIKLRVGDRVIRDRIISDICNITRSEIIQKIGNTLVIFRENKKQPGITLPGK